MKISVKQSLGLGVAALLAFGGAGSVAAAPPQDWSVVPAQTVKLFYPGQGGYDWLRSPDHQRADQKVLRGDSCASCHEGEQQEIGDLIVSGQRLEPTPIPGKNGWVDLNVQVAYDAENAYFRFQWKTHMNRPGQMHDYMRFDGEKWSFYGGARSDKGVRSGEAPAIYEDRLALMIDDGAVPLFREQGCWLTCHQAMRDMPDEASKDAVQAHPRLGKDGLNESDVRKYLPFSRSDENAGWDKVKSAEDVAQLKANGQFLELMQWRAGRSNPVGMADDGYVLEYRLSDEGTGPFTWNVDRKTMTPKFMFDASKTGMKSITVAEIGDPAKPYAVIQEENAVPYDANAGWKADDVLPGRLLTRAGTKGSAADNEQAKGEWKDGVWTVVWTRKMNTGHPEDDKILQEGKAYTVGFAVHDDNATTRFHFVGFPVTIGFGTAGDIQATKLQ